MSRGRLGGSSPRNRNWARGLGFSLARVFAFPRLPTWVRRRCLTRASDVSKISGKSTFLYFFLHAPRAARVRHRPRRARAETSRAAVPALPAMRNRRLVPLGLRRAAPRRDRAERARQIGIVARSRYSCCSLAISAGRGESFLRSAFIRGRFHSVHLRELPELELAASDRVASAVPPGPLGRLNLRLSSF